MSIAAQKVVKELDMVSLTTRLEMETFDWLAGCNLSDLIGSHLSYSLEECGDRTWLLPEKIFARILHHFD